MLYIVDNNGGKALVEVRRIERGELVKLIKVISVTDSNFLDSWILANPDQYRKLTIEDKLEML